MVVTANAAVGCGRREALVTETTLPPTGTSVPRLRIVVQKVELMVQARGNVRISLQDRK